MYCKNCGKEITDNSNFCQYCGSEQSVGANTFLKRVFKCLKLNKLDVALFVFWLVLNASLLLFGGHAENARNVLYPFCFDFFGVYMSGSIDYYDITDFVFYVVLVPPAFVSIKAIVKSIKNKVTSNNAK